MKTGKLSALTVMAVLALWVSGCGAGSTIVVPDEILDIPQDVGDQGDDVGDDTGDEPIVPEEDGPGHATPTPGGLGDGIPHATGDKPMVSQRPDWGVAVAIPATEHDAEPHDVDGSQWGHAGSFQQVAPVQICDDCLEEWVDQ